MRKRANAHEVNAPIASLFHMMHHWRRGTDAQRQPQKRMPHSSRQRVHKTQPAPTGGPPRPPKKTARGLEDQSPDGSRIPIPDPVPVSDLAAALARKPFQIIADLMEIGLFKNVREAVAFDDASKIARKYGFEARKVG